MKNIFDMKHVKGVRAWALTYKGQIAGKVVANYSDNPMGSVCTAQVIFFRGPLSKDETPKRIPLGKAGGYGYDKFSTACEESLRMQGIEIKESMGGVGDTAVKAFLEKHGYSILEVI